MHCYLRLSGDPPGRTPAQRHLRLNHHEGLQRRLHPQAPELRQVSCALSRQSTLISLVGSPQTHSNDIALVRLAEEADISVYTPACLPDTNQAGKYCAETLNYYYVEQFNRLVVN